MRHHFLSRTFVTLAAFLAAANASAQDSYQPGGFMYVNHIQNTALMNLTINPAVDEIAEKSGSEGYSGTATANTAPPRLTAAALASLGFKASPQRRIANLDKIFTGIDDKTPGAGSQLREAFASNNIFGEVEKVMADYGMRADNIADTFAIYWVTSWQAVNSDDQDPSKASIAAVKRQAAQAMLAVDGVKNMSEAAKQEMADGLIVSVVILSALQELAKTDPSQRATVVRQATEDAEMMGLDHSLLTLTDAGFVRKQ